MQNSYVNKTDPYILLQQNLVCILNLTGIFQFPGSLHKYDLSCWGWIKSTCNGPNGIWIHSEFHILTVDESSAILVMLKDTGLQFLQIKHEHWVKSRVIRKSKSSIRDFSTKSVHLLFFKFICQFMSWATYVPSSLKWNSRFRKQNSIIYTANHWRWQCITWSSNETDFSSYISSLHCGNYFLIN